MTAEVKFVVFDCDGTLVDSQHMIVRAVEIAFSGEGLAPPGPEAIRHIVGLSLDEAIGLLVPDSPDETVLRLVAGYRSAFATLRTHDDFDEPLFDGILELLDALRAEGVLLGVATGKSDRGIGKTLDMHGLRDHFASVQGSDRHPSKPHPAMLECALNEVGAEPENSIFIGDTSYDMMMARSAGLLAIGVAWGYHDIEQLRQSGAQEIVQEVPALLPVIKKGLQR